MDFSISGASTLSSSAPLNFAHAADAGDVARGLVADASSSCISSSSSTSSASSITSSSILDALWPVSRASYSCLTSDGVRLHLTRGVCKPAAAARPRTYPVMLVPGLASSGEATWDITPGLSLIEHLSRQGYDVWAVDLRGATAFGGCGREGLSHVKITPRAAVAAQGAKMRTILRCPVWGGLTSLQLVILLKAQQARHKGCCLGNQSTPLTRGQPLPRYAPNPRQWPQRGPQHASFDGRLECG